jgi:hypothetical protein
LLWVSDRTNKTTYNTGCIILIKKMKGRIILPCWISHKWKKYIKNLVGVTFWWIISKFCNSFLYFFLTNTKWKLEVLGIIQTHNQKLSCKLQMIKKSFNQGSDIFLCFLNDILVFRDLSKQNSSNGVLKF